ncbi:hypothetical protein [Brevibacterium sp. UCMA 11754]|uniref:hypothetical protein n=1 Tax=Brevibacterium sp. UCMA 11754 TaxID=2749198 RepID=UPI001F18FFB2|nr:hypothetical protein [Brevibacterium sp. UCMA 11754]MCF2573212.1 hypothetical protein [Brevibacterium sp. UCMA 11754]
MTTADPATAACKGSNARKAVGAGGGGMNPVDKYEVKMDSCAASKLVDGFDDATSASGLIDVLGAKWWPVSFSTAPIIAWAWKNKTAVRTCEKSGKGIKFTESNGMITNCKSQ